MFPRPYPLRVLPHSPCVLPWFAFRTGSGIAELRRIALEARYGRSRTGMAFYSVCWPLIAIKRTATYLRHEARAVRRVAGVRRRTQWRHLLGLAWRHNVDPYDYYLSGLWEDAKRSRIAGWVHAWELDALLDYSLQGTDTAMLDSKFRFPRLCRELDLACAPSIAFVEEPGGVTWCDGHRSLPPGDLFVKPTEMCSGAGAERWQHDAGSGGWRSGAEHLPDQAALLEHCRRRAADLQVENYRWLHASGPVLRCRQQEQDNHRMVIQPRLRNHPSVEPLSNGSLCTLRVVTLRMPGGPPGILPTCLRMPTGNAAIDNFSAGGLVCTVRDGGVMGPARSKHIGAGEFSRHPDTGAPIDGATLPFWRDAVALALRAHSKIDLLGSIGWDLALTPNGPLLLEANSRWGTIVQIYSGIPLGDTRWVEVYLAWLDRCGLRRSPSPA